MAQGVLGLLATVSEWKTAMIGESGSHMVLHRSPRIKDSTSNGCSSWRPTSLERKKS
jgi:hypothetical protein